MVGGSDLWTVRHGGTMLPTRSDTSCEVITVLTAQSVAVHEPALLLTINQLYRSGNPGVLAREAELELDDVHEGSLRGND